MITVLLGLGDQNVYSIRIRAASAWYTGCSKVWNELSLNRLLQSRTLSLKTEEFGRCTKVAAWLQNGFTDDCVTNTSARGLMLPERL